MKGLDIMKKTLLAIMLIASTMILPSCNDEEDTTVSNSAKNIEHTTITRVSETESEYTEIDYYENLEIDHICGTYPFLDIMIDGKLNLPVNHSVTLLGVEMTAEHDGEKIDITLRVDEHYFSQEYTDEHKIIPTSREKKIEIDVNDFNQLVYRKEQYTDEIDVAATEAIMKYFEEEGINVEIVEKHLYVYDGDGEYGEIRVSDGSLSPDKDGAYYREEDISEYVGTYRCLRAICYSQDKGRYYPVTVTAMIRNNGLVDIEVDNDYMQTSSSIEEAYKWHTLLTNDKYGENMKFIEYTK